MIITDPNGNPVDVFVRQSGDYIDALIRAETKADWDAEAAAAGLVVNGEPIPGASVDELGPVVLTPAVPGPEPMTIATPAVMDNRHHVNLRLAASLNWQPLALQWTVHGSPDPAANNAEVCHLINRVGLIDPATIALPKRVWF